MRFSLRSLLVATTCLSLAIGLGAWIARETRAASQSRRIRNSMQQACLGVLSYASARGQFPPPALKSNSGKELTSWRFQIVPFLVQRPTQGDEAIGWHRLAPWDDPIHKPLADFIGDFYVWSGGNETKWTNLFAVAGPGTAFDAQRAVRQEDCPEDTILAMEVVRSKTNWMQPGDYDVSELLSHSGRIGDHLHGLLADRFHVLFADGEVWALSPDAPMTALQRFLTIAGAKAHDRDKLLAAHRVD
jgi:hypothetical protein